MYNVVVFVSRRSDLSYLMVTFYVLVTIDCCFHIGVMGYLAGNPSRDPFIYGDGNSDALDCVSATASASAQALDWFVTATMYQLSISIKVICRKMSS